MQKLRNVNEVAELLGISPWTVRAYIRDGKLRPVRLGRRVLLEEEQLERLVYEGRSSREANTGSKTAGSAEQLTGESNA